MSRTTEITGDAYLGSYILREWGAISQLLGDMADAKRRLQDSYTIQKDFRDLKGMGETLTKLGRIALLEGTMPRPSDVTSRSEPFATT